MSAIPKKVLDRYSKSIGKFQKVLRIAHDRDINEADTVSIIQDMLAEVFGFQKYIEITGEYAIRNTYCDLAIKIEDKVQYLIEVKAIGLNLKEQHLKQAIDYGANKGIQWVVLTNGIDWMLYKIRFEKPIGYDLVASFNMLNINSRKIDDQQVLFLLTKEGLSKSVREEFYEKVQNVNRFVLGALVLSEPVINLLRRDVRKLSSGLKVEPDEIEKILKNEVLKRDVIEGEEANKALIKLKKSNRKTSSKSTMYKDSKQEDVKDKDTSFSDRFLEAGDHD